MFTSEKYSPLKNIHPWKIFTPGNIHPLKMFTLKIFTPEKYKCEYRATQSVDSVSFANWEWAPEKVLSILSLYSIWCWRKCFGTIHGWAWTAMKKTKKGFAVSSFYDFLKIAAIVQRYSEIKLPLRKETLNIVTLKMHFSASSQWSKICFGYQWIIFNG